MGCGAGMDGGDAMGGGEVTGGDTVPQDANSSQSRTMVSRLNIIPIPLARLRGSTYLDSDTDAFAAFLRRLNHAHKGSSKVLHAHFPCSPSRLPATCAVVTSTSIGLR